MLAEERMNEILSLVNERGSVTVPQLMELLDASESTIRRDLVKLDSMRRLVKVHGGATALPHEYVSSDLAYASRYGLCVEEKREIARLAATKVAPGDFVFIDAGTTTEFLADYLTEYSAVYVTNSLPLAGKLLTRGLRCLLPGGEVKATTMALVGEETTGALMRYHFTVGFFGTNGMDIEDGFTTPEFSEATVKQVALQHSQRRYMLADSSKFSKTSLVTFAAFDAATVITDSVPNEYRACDNIICTGKSGEEVAES